MIFINTLWKQHAVFYHSYSFSAVDALWVKLHPFLDRATLFQLSALFPTIFFSFCCLFCLLPLHWSHAIFKNLTPISFFSVSITPLSDTTSPKQHPSLFPLVSFYVLPLFPPIYPSLSLSFPLISLPMPWFVSSVSVRAVITAVSSLGENKVVLCSQHHKRHERNKRKRASALKGNK